MKEREAEKQKKGRLGQMILNASVMVLDSGMVAIVV